MSTQHNDGGPAFPIAFQHRNESDGVIEQRWLGLSLRDYFAAHAQDQLSRGAEPTKTAEVCGVALPLGTADSVTWSHFWIRCEAVLRYRYADAMLRAREQK